MDLTRDAQDTAQKLQHCNIWLAQHLYGYTTGVHKVVITSPLPLRAMQSAAVTVIPSVVGVSHAGARTKPVAHIESFMRHVLTWQGRLPCFAAPA